MRGRELGSLEPAAQEVSFNGIEFDVPALLADEHRDGSRISILGFRRTPEIKVNFGASSIGMLTFFGRHKPMRIRKTCGFDNFLAGAFWRQPAAENLAKVAQFVKFTPQGLFVKPSI